MQHKCFFVESVEPGAEEVILSENASHHAEKVLRSKPGDPVEMRDGRGNRWLGVIERVGSGTVHIRVTGKGDLANESPLELTLALAMARSDPMELVLRQATEMGVHRFAAFRAERSQYGLDGAQAAKRKARWLKIAREALCQCGRMRLPEIVVLPDVSGLLDAASGWEGEEGQSLRILAREGERRQSVLSLWEAAPECRRVLAVVGPEGGWTPGEVEKFQAGAFHSVHLGPRILRLETAAIAVLSLAQLLWGDFGYTAEGRIRP